MLDSEGGVVLKIKSLTRGRSRAAAELPEIKSLTRDPPLQNLAPSFAQKKNIVVAGNAFSRKL